MPQQLLLANPAKRKRRKSSAKKRAPARRRTTSVTKSVTRRYRRNPIRRGGQLMDIASKGLTGAVGALGVDVAMDRIPGLANIATDEIGGPLVKSLVGVGIGMVVERFGRNKRLGLALAEGAVTVQAHSALKSLIGPTVGLSDDGLLDYSLMGDDMGYFSAEPVFPSDGSDDF